MKNSLRWQLTWTLIIVFLFSLFLHRAWFIPETDYIAYYTAGKRAITGANLYVNEDTPFKYLPVISYLFVPFSLLPFQISKLIFFFLNFTLGVVTYTQIYRRLGHILTLVVLATLWRFHNYDFLNSQVNHILLFLLVTYLYLRNTRLILASLALALLASFKVVPLLVLGPLFFMRRYRELAWTVAWFFLLCLIPLFTFRDGIYAYANWFALLRNTSEFPAPAGAIIQSVQAALWYWLGPFLQLHYFLVLNYFVQLSLFGICCFASRRVTSDQKAQPRIIMASVILSIMISPLAWKHNFLLILPALVILLEARQYYSVGLVFLFLDAWPGMVGIFSKHWVDRSYATLIGTLVLFFALIPPFFQALLKFTQKKSRRPTPFPS